MKLAWIGRVIAALMAVSALGFFVASLWPTDGRLDYLSIVGFLTLCGSFLMTLITQAHVDRHR